MDLWALILILIFVGYVAVGVVSARSTNRYNARVKAKPGYKEHAWLATRDDRGSDQGAGM